MRMKTGSKLITAITAFACGVTLWFACTKVTSNPGTCIGVVCKSGGYCHIDTFTNKPKCYCPTGYEGAICDTASVTKYLGYWDLTQIITGSDSTGFNSDTSHYEVYLTTTATPTTFFINNFKGSPYYNNIICTIDSINTRNFVVDTISAYHMLFDHYRLLYGGGYIAPMDTLIRIDLATRHLSATTNWINDTMIYILRPHH